MNKAIGILGGLCLLAMVGATAQAATVANLPLNNDNCTGGCGPGDPAVLGNVKLTDTAAGVDFHITLTPGYLFNLAGGPGLMTFSFNTNVVLTAGDFTLPTGFSAIIGAANVGNQDGFKTFNYAINGNAGIIGSNTLAGPLDFSVAGLDFSDFIVSSGTGGEHVFFAADLIGPTGNTGLVGSAGLTINPTDEENPPGTPIPGAVWLFGTVLAGGAGFGRWRKRRKVQLAA